MTEINPVPPKSSDRWLWFLLAVGIILTVIFGYRALHSFMRVRMTRLQPGSTDVEAIRPWMTVPFLSRTFNVPKDYLYQQINVPPAGSDPKSLFELEREYFPKQPGVVIEKIKAVIRGYLLTPPPRPTQ
jgi:hypothetical protein